MAWKGSSRKARLPGNWSAIRKAVLQRDKYRCQIGWVGCLTRASEADHIVAGDDHSLENLQAACRHCHAKKSGLEGNAAKAARKAARFRPQEGHPGRLRSS